MTLFCMVLVLASCSKRPDYSRMIPKDAVFVMDIDLGQIWQKGDLENADNLSFIKLLRQELRNENAQTAAIVDGVFDNPASAGIDVRGDMAFYVDVQTNATLIATMKSQKKFEQFLQQLAGDTPLDIVEKDGISTVSQVGGLPMTLAWDKEKVLLFVNDNPDVAKMMNLKKEESLAKNKDFSTFWDKRGDISMWFDFGNLMHLVDDLGGAEAFAELGDYREEMEKMSGYCNFIFDKGAIRCVFESFGFDKNSDIMKIPADKLNEKVLAFMPEQTFLALSYAVNMEHFLKYMSKMDMYEEMMETEVVEGVTVFDIFSSLGGSIVASLYDFGTGEEGGLLPLFAAAADVKDAAKISETMSGLGLEQENGCWVVPQIPLYVGIKDNVIFATDDASAAAKMQKEGYKNGLKEHSKGVKKGNYLFADLDIDHYPATVSGLLPQSLVKLLRIYVDNAEFCTTNKTTGELVINLKEKKQNSLYTTLHFIDDNLMLFASLGDELLGGFGDDEDCPVYEEEFYVEE